jgi:chromatin remodeling complex protein RSC6
MKEIKMAEAKGLNKPVKLKNELAEFLGATELPRTEITKKLWDYIKANKLQTKTENGKPENAGKFIVADAKLIPIFKNTNSKSKSGKVTNLTELKEGQTINMMQMAAVVGANIE